MSKETLEEKLIRERKEELKQVSERDKSSTKLLEEMLRDKSVAKETDFTSKSEKEKGVSAGYIATENETDKTFILKKFYKNDVDAITEQEEQDRGDGVREFIGSSLYEALLYDRAPKEQLVVSSEGEKAKHLYIRSKFFDNVESLESVLKKDNPPKIEGFEKLVAACNILGEFDYHNNNILVQKTFDNEGREIFQAVKIDHGRSFYDVYTNFESMIDNTSSTFIVCDYGKNIDEGKLTFDVKEYSKALNQMIAQFDDNHINNIVDQKVSELKKAGFNPKDTGIVYDVNKKLVKVNNFEELALNIKQRIKQNIEGMKDVAKNVEIISKFSNVTEEFKNGGWLEAFANSKEKDAISFAKTNKIKIEGKIAFIWAGQNTQILSPTPEIITNVPEQKWQKINNTNKWEAKEIINPKLMVLIDNFTNNIKDKEKLSEKQVEKFYDDFIDILKESKRISEEEAYNIKNSGIVQEVIAETTKLVNFGLTRLTKEDRLCYKIADFCERIKLPDLSKDFANEITSDNLGKIEKLKKVITKNILQLIPEKKNVISKKDILYQSHSLTERII